MASEMQVHFYGTKFQNEKLSHSSFAIINCISMGVLKTDTCGMIKEGEKEYLDDNRPNQA